MMGATTDSTDNGEHVEENDEASTRRDEEYSPTVHSLTTTSSTRSAGSFSGGPDVSIKYSLQHRMRGRLNVIKGNPRLLFLFCFIFFALSALLIMGVINYASFENEDRKNGLMDRTEEAIVELEIGLQTAAFGASAMALYTHMKVIDKFSSVQIPESIEEDFEYAANLILER